MQPIRRWQTASAVPHAPGTNRFELPVRLSPRPRRARHSVSAGVAKGGRAASAGRQLRTKSLRERARKKLREVPLTCLEQGGMRTRSGETNSSKPGPWASALSGEKDTHSTSSVCPWSDAFGLVSISCRMDSLLLRFALLEDAGGSLQEGI